MNSSCTTEPSPAVVPSPELWLAPLGLHARLDKWPAWGMLGATGAHGSANVPPLVHLAAAITSVLGEITARWSTVLASCFNPASFASCWREVQKCRNERLYHNAVPCLCHPVLAPVACSIPREDWRSQAGLGCSGMVNANGQNGGAGLVMALWGFLAGGGGNSPARKGKVTHRGKEKVLKAKCQNINLVN